MGDCRNPRLYHRESKCHARGRVPLPRRKQLRSNDLFEVAAIPLTIATDRRAVSGDLRHRWQRGSVLLQSILGEVRAQVCGRLSAQKRWRNSKHVSTSTHRAKENITGTQIQYIHGRFIFERREFRTVGAGWRGHTHEEPLSHAPCRGCARHRWHAGGDEPGLQEQRTCVVHSDVHATAPHKN
jgi:hypothetical protein